MMFSQCDFGPYPRSKSEDSRCDHDEDELDHQTPHKRFCASPLVQSLNPEFQSGSVTGLTLFDFYLEPVMPTKHPPGPPMDLANMRRQGVQHRAFEVMDGSASPKSCPRAAPPGSRRAVQPGTCLPGSVAALLRPLTVWRRPAPVLPAANSIQRVPSDHFGL
jgi:hypothetical protein